MHEVRGYLLNQKRMELKQLNRKIANFDPPPLASSFAPKSGGGFMKRLAKADKSELVVTERQLRRGSQLGRLRG